MIAQLNEGINFCFIPTENESPIYKNRKGEMVYDEGMTSSKDVQHYHIYVIVKDELKDGDWHVEDKSILNKFPDYLTDLDVCEKVLRTTDTTLGLEELPFNAIEKMIRYYNSNLNQ